MLSDLSAPSVLNYIDMCEAARSSLGAIDFRDPKNVARGTYLIIEIFVLQGLRDIHVTHACQLDIGSPLVVPPVNLLVAAFRAYPSHVSLTRKRLC